MNRTLLVGASNQVSVSLLESQAADVSALTVCSRRSRPSGVTKNVAWIEGGIQAPRLKDWETDNLVYLAPLNQLPRLMDRVIVKRTVLMFSSTSARTKSTSPSRYERAIAEMLQFGEAAAIEWGNALNVPVQIFRPTLIYGRGIDRNVTLLARVIRRWSRIPLPAGRLGLRQPVLADDLAAAVLAALKRLPAEHATYELGGGERLSYEAMVDRIFASLGVPATCHRLPAPALRAAVAALRIHPRFRGLDPAMIDRMRDDLVADNRPANAAFGYSPQSFSPTTMTWEPRGLESVRTSP